MNDSIKNMGKSVHDRLLNISRRAGLRYNDLQQRFAMERFLYRLSISPFAQQFTLKGALAFLAWTGENQMYRSTMDIDLLGQTSNTEENLKSIFQTVAKQQTPNDGLEFDADNIVIEPISEDAEYNGMRVRLTGRLANARVSIQIDIGFSDTPIPTPQPIELPGLLDFPKLSMRGYRPESSIAEKFHAMVQKDVLNSRMKDFADIWYLSKHFAFSGPTLAEAIANTFNSRNIAVPLTPIAFTAEFIEREDKQTQWKAFLRRTSPEGISTDFAQIVTDIAAFLSPILAHLAGDKPVVNHWPASGPWQ